MAKFTVDTHLFRELGELLVGRDSTALVELVKNAYDADATEVVVFGERLNDPERGRIIVTDNGTGMTSEVFNEGFLRVASRLKEERNQRSQRFGRRYTGAKGIGRLAAHKLARRLEVTSAPWTEKAGAKETIRAVIDWDKVEAQTTLDDLEGSDAIVVGAEATSRAKAGTTITLARLRRAWTPEERARFFAEVQSFDAPEFLKRGLPDALVRETLLFANPQVRERVKVAEGDKFSVRLEGDFASGEDYWQIVAQTASWVVEIQASKDGHVHYAVAPTKRTASENKDAETFTASMPHPSPNVGPFFDARILVRVGEFSRNKDQRVWASRSSGIRVYLEGFRVLPYGEPKDDWLSIDADYTRRRRTLDLLQDWAGDSALPTVTEEDKDAPLVHLPNNNYVGAVFLTQTDASSLRALVNREGFIPEAGFDTLVRLVRTGVDLCTRVRAAAGYAKREERKHRRGADETPPGPRPDATSEKSPGGAEGLRGSIGQAADLAHKARALVSSGDVAGAKKVVEEVSAKLAAIQTVTEDVIGEQALLRVVASVGTQMAAFVHEVNALLGAARTIENAVAEMMGDDSLERAQRKRLKATMAAVSDLRRGLERQASYLMDVVTPDARRRRSRQKLADRFDAATSLVAQQAERRGILIINDIERDLRTPPMFAAEVTTVFANLLTNAVKAARSDGEIRASASVDDEGGVRVRLENTGVAVKLQEAERWFRPFESTTVEVNPVLGQGMGLGLPITRSVLKEYGAEIKFVKPSSKYATAIEITFPV